jgi:uroporphyrinogen III methyltransferase/synthase
MEISRAETDGIDDAIDGLERIDWIVFSSRHGVKYFMERLFELGGDSRKLSRVLIASVGGATDEALRAFGLRSDWAPQGDQGAEGLLSEWLPQALGKRVLLVRTAEGSELLREGLVSGVEQLQSVDVYKQSPVLGWQDIEAIRSKIVHEARLGLSVWITATSSNIARAAWVILGADSDAVRWLVISPRVADVLVGLGCRRGRIVVAQRASFESMGRAIAVAELIGTGLG